MITLHGLTKNQRIIADTLWNKCQSQSDVDAVLKHFGHDARVGKWTTMFPNTEICGDCIIGENCIFGIGSYVLPGKKLANGVKVSAGSIVRHDYDQDHHCDIVLQGNPARPRS